MIIGKLLPLAALLLLSRDGFSLTRKKFDFVVGVDGDFKAAMAAAAKSASASNRFYLFFPDGEYDIGALTGDANQMTTFPTANVSFVGQSMDKTVVFNRSTTEGISITATLYFNGANNLYMQDLTVFNKAVYGNTALYNTTGRHVAIMERANKVVYKNVKLLSTQDTYYTKGTRTYWEGGAIHGTTDFLCGGGDVFFQKTLIYALKKSAITAPATTSSWGYVFNECTVDGDVSDFVLGRSWGDARAVFLNSTMKKLPTAAAWGDPMNSVPKVFAEYKSRNASGALVDLSKRRTSYTKGTTTVTLNPVLTDAEAAKYTVANVLGGSDNWQPQVAAQQVAAPVVVREGALLKWNDDPKALCWALFRNGKFLASVATNSYSVTTLAVGDVVTVRAANEMGGLGASSTALTIAATTSLSRRSASGLRHSYDPRNRVLRLSGGSLAGAAVRLHRPDGTLVRSWDLDPDPSRQEAELPLPALASGSYVLSYGAGDSMRSASLEVR